VEAAGVKPGLEASFGKFVSCARGWRPEQVLTKPKIDKVLFVFNDLNIYSRDLSFYILHFTWSG
jgi:hypothetical protein